MRGKALQVLFLLRKLGTFLGKYKVVALVVVVLLIGVIGWQVQRSSENTKWTKATDAYRRADYQEVSKILGDSKPPKDAERLNMYAQTMLATRQLDRAADGYKKLYDQKKDPFAKLVLGNVYNQQKKYDEAVKIYEELIASNPEYAQAYVNLATLYKVQGKSDKAVEVADKAVTNNPSNTILNELLVSMTMQDKNSAKYKKAVEQLKKLNPNDPLLASINQQ